jgi:hypothetical protein
MLVLPVRNRGIVVTIKVVWDNDEQTTIRYDFEFGWKWEEFHAAAEEAFAMTRSVEHKVDTITNFKPGVSLPPNAMLHFRRAMVDAPPNRGMNVIVGGPMFVKTMVSIFSKINRSLGERLMLASSVEDARERLEARRKK